MKNSGLLLFALLAFTAFLTDCKKAPTETKEYYFYADQVYYQFKVAQLLNCLNKSSDPDSCNCSEKYWEKGDPEPADNFPPGTITIPGRVVHTECCPCNKTQSIFRLNQTGNDDPPPADTGPIIIECPCPSLGIAVDSLHDRTLKIGGGKKKSEDEITSQVKKERISKDNRTVYYYSFPGNFSDTVQVFFRGTDLGHVVVVNGKLENWLTSPD